MFGYYILVFLVVINYLQTISSLDTVGFKSIIKCREYQRSPMQNTINSDPDAIVFPGEIHRRSSIQDKNTTRYAFSAIIYNGENEAQCEGVLISEYFVLTAVHCLLLRDQTWIRSGQTIESVAIGQNASFATPNERIKVSRTILHPRYKANSVYHDIGLIELEKPVQIAQDVRPACLQTSSTIADHEWFMNEWTLEYTRWETISVTEEQSDECQKRYEDIKKTPYGVIGHLQICTFIIRNSIRNPIFLRNKALPGYTIIGIPCVGFYIGSALPQVFTRISYYIGWIESHVWPDEPKRGCNKFLFSH